MRGMPTTAPSGQVQASMSKKKTPGIWLLVALCIPVICLAMYYTPFLVSLGWHALHGMTVNYRGLRILVPLGWTADLTLMKDDFPSNPQGVTVEKQPKSLAFEVPGPEMMYFNVLLPDADAGPDQQAEQWEHLFRRAHPDSQFDVTSHTEPAPGMNCLEATPLANKAAVALTCISVKDGWIAEYAGARERMAQFLTIASGLKPKS
jgi:hypothetical protein